VDLEFQQAKSILCKQNKSAKNLEKTQQQKSKDVIGKPKPYLVSKTTTQEQPYPTCKIKISTSCKRVRLNLDPREKSKAKP